MKSSQSAVLNLTGRQRIHTDQVRVHASEDSLRVHKIDSDGWAEHVAEELLEAAILHVDVRSLHYQARQSTPVSTGVFEPGWEGLQIPLPGGLGDGQYRVKAQVAIVLPASLDDGGRVLARSEEFVVLEGDMGEEPDDGGEGASLLPTRPNAELDGLCRLEITHQGPVLMVNSGIDGLSWREIATHPFFKYAIFTPCIEAVLLHIALSDEIADTWAEDWLELPGVEGVDELIEEEDDVTTAFQKATDWAQECARKVAVNRGLIGLFVDARKQEKS